VPGLPPEAGEAIAGQTFGVNTEARAVKQNDFGRFSSSVDEEKRIAGHRVLTEFALDQAIEPVEPVAEIGGSGSRPDAHHAGAADHDSDGKSAMRSSNPRPSTT